MANKRLSMRKIREVLRLCGDKGLSARQAAGSCGVARGTVRNILDRAMRAGLSWPLPADLDDAALENRLFPSAIPLEVERRDMPSFEYIRKELTRKHVTLQLLWHEYKEKNPEGYEYSQFCLRYRSWQKTLEVSLRQDHKAGEKLFVDFAGDTIPIHDPQTGAVISLSLPWARVTTPMRKPSSPRIFLPGSACTFTRSNSWIVFPLSWSLTTPGSE
jgi:hypothetical protein